MSKSSYKTYDHDENKLSLRDYIEELEQDDECITKNDIQFKIYINVMNKKVYFLLEIRDLNTNQIAQSDPMSTKFDSKKKVINWIKTSQLLTGQTFNSMIKKSNGILMTKIGENLV